MIESDEELFDRLDATIQNGEVLLLNFEMVKAHVERWSRLVEEHEIAEGPPCSCTTTIVTQPNPKFCIGCERRIE